jgi:hypothetical protein
VNALDGARFSGKKEKFYENMVIKYEEAGKT